MRIRVEHDTTYRYDRTANYTIQMLRVTARDHGSQRVIRWAIDTGARRPLPACTDCFGNLSHMLVIEEPHDQVTVRVVGEVETADTAGVLRDTQEPLPPALYLRSTPLTTANAALRALAEECRTGASGVIDCLHRLMGRIRDTVDYRVGATHSATTAAESLAQGEGVCQDHAHVFIAAARVLGIPARYVSGYLLGGVGEGPYEAAHAWAEALVPDLGWVGFDVANRLCVTDAYVRTGVGLDYLGTAPVRGLRRGGGEESLAVQVRVTRLS